MEATQSFEVDCRFDGNLVSQVSLVGVKTCFHEVRRRRNARVESTYLLEIEAMLDHLFRHINTPAHMAKRGNSSFCHFKPFAFLHPICGGGLPKWSVRRQNVSGSHGDLSTLAFWLHPEARSYDANEKYSGTLREPMVKVIYLVRAMEYKDAHDEPIVFRQLRNVLWPIPFFAHSVFNFYVSEMSFSESEGDAMSESALVYACGLPPTATVDGLEIEAVGPLVLLENFLDLFRGSLWLHLVYASSSVTQGDIQIGEK